MAVRLSAPGLVCCAGRGGEAVWRGLIAGDCSGMRTLVFPDGKRFLAGQVQEPPSSGGGDGCAAPPGWPAFAGTSLFSLVRAALEQIRGETDAALAAYGPERVGVCLGSCDNGSEASTPAHRRFFAEGAFPAGYRAAWQSPALAADWLARCSGARGPCMAAATACASGASALVLGARLIGAGLADAVIAGGADLASEAALRGFDALELISPRLSNPLSRNRSGVTLGSGAALFLLSRAAGAEGELCLLGWGESADAFHSTAPRPDGSGAAAAMRGALAMAAMRPEDIGYVNLHGTGTVLNDRMEALAMASVFGGDMPLSSSTKPVTGHTLGAAGALELAFCALALDRARGGAETPLPVHCWDGLADGELPAMNLVAPGRGGRLRAAMSNSFAFGGCNVSLIIGGYDERYA